MNRAAVDDCTTAAIDARWRILLVDDCADDAELIGIELAHAGIDADLLHVDSEEKLLDALQAFAPQLVLSDMRMPGFSGQRAIELVREHAPGAWFVFLSGDAVDHSGGGDARAENPLPTPDAWLCKDDLDRLPELVRGLLGG